MPVYEYRCDRCGERFEELVSPTAESPPCPRCASGAVTRVLSLFATAWKPGNVNWHRMPGRF